VEEIKKSLGEIINSFNEIKREASSHSKALYTQDKEYNKYQRLKFMELIPHLITD
jgi:hypothetical protein